MHTSVFSPPAQRGFTLMELMVTVGILAILVALAAPAFRNAVMNVRMSAQANDLMGDLNLARSEAIKRNLTVIVCPSVAPHTNCSGQDFKVGWMVFVDADNDGTWDAGVPEAPIKQHGPGPSDTAFTITASATVPTGTPGSTKYLRYKPTGVSMTSAAVQTVTFCDGRGAASPNSGRRITLSPTGRTVITRLTC